MGLDQRAFQMGTKYHSSPKNLRPILLVINIANPEAICA